VVNHPESKKRNFKITILKNFKLNKHGYHFWIHLDKAAKVFFYGFSQVGAFKVFNNKKKSFFELFSVIFSIFEFEFFQKPDSN
jgi:hypothetical protein